MEGLQNGMIDGQRPRGRSRRKGSKGATDRVSHKKKSFFARAKRDEQTAAGTESGEVSAAEKVPERNASVTAEESLAENVRDIMAAENGHGVEISENRKTAADSQGASLPESMKKDEADQKTDNADLTEDSHATADRKRILLIVAAAAGITLCAAGAAYGIMGQKYKNVYYSNTLVNGIDVSGRTPEQAEELIAAGIRSYILTLDTRTGEETIAGSDIDLHPEYDGSLEYILGRQSALLWGQSLWKEVSYTIETMISYDQEKLQATVDALVCMDTERMEAPENAAISDYISGVGYEIVPETQGCKPDVERTRQAIADAIINLQPTLSLEELDVYEKPQITSEDEGLNQRLAVLNQYAQMNVTYLFGSQREVLNGDTIHAWISLDEQGNVQVDEAQISEYVQQLGKKYNTAYQPKQLKTSYGETVTITKGNYGWRINQKEEIAVLTELVRTGQSQEREPVYLQKAASHDGLDYGNTYVEINLTAQHLYFYKDGKLVVESDFVSGNEARGFSTPAGAYPLTYKQRNATLKGEGYSTPVSYWMPFNGGIGMHDANWRSSFGGKIYKTNGSHGCINLPTSVAKTIYENIEAGMPVLCYHLGGTETGTSSSSSDTAKPAQQQTAAANQSAPETAASANPSASETAAADSSVPETAAAEAASEQESAPASEEVDMLGTAAAVPENPAGQQTSDTGQTSSDQTSSGIQTGPGQSSGGTAAQPGASAGGPGVQQTPQSGASAGPGAEVSSDTSSGVLTQPVPGNQTQTSPTPGTSAGPGATVGPGM